MLAKTKILGFMLATTVALVSPKMVWADNGGNFAGGAEASHQDGGWKHGRGHHHILAKVLNLSEDQQKQLKDIKKSAWEANKGIFEQLKANREAFDAEIVKAAADTNKINALQAQLKTIQAQMADNHLNSILAIKKIMSPEQFAGYMALEKAKRMMMHKGHHQFGPKGGPCKMGGHKHWGDKDGDKSDQDHDAGPQE